MGTKPTRSDNYNILLSRKLILLYSKIMSLFDFFKFNHRTSVPSEVDEVLLSENKSLYIDFDKMCLSVVGGFKRLVAVGEFEWQEELDLQVYGSDSAATSLPAKVIAAINDLKHRLEGGVDVSVSLPLDLVFTKYITIPKTDVSEKVLRAEMKKYVPLPFEEMLFASNKVKEDKSQVSYFCVVIHKSLFDNYISIFKNYGIQPYFELGCFSLARLAPPGVSLLVYVGFGESYTMLVRDGVLLEVNMLSVSQFSMSTTLAKMYEISNSDAILLLRSLLENKNNNQLKSKDMLVSFLKNSYENLIREVVVVRDGCNVVHGISLEQVVFTGTDLSVLKEVAISSGVSGFTPYPLFVSSKEINRYTHQIGLAKRP